MELNTRNGCGEGHLDICPPSSWNEATCCLIDKFLPMYYYVYSHSYDGAANASPLRIKAGLASGAATSG